MLSATPEQVRQLVLLKQRLAGTPPPPTKEGIMEIARNIRVIQVDPVSVVAPSYYLVLWSRLGKYNTDDLESLLWEEKKLIQNWAHASSYVLTEDYPIFKKLMDSWGTEDGKPVKRTWDWIQKNRELESHILEALSKRPMLSKDFEDKSRTDWWSTGWTSNRNVSRMLNALWAQGKIMITGRQGNNKLWTLTETHLPSWTPWQELTWREHTKLAVQHSLKSLGIAQSRHIRDYYIRRSYTNLEDCLQELEQEGTIHKIKIEDTETKWMGTWYIHDEDVKHLQNLDTLTPKTTLLSPFDNLIIDRQRTLKTFNFKYSFELYLKPEKRKYGPYTLPILHQHKLIGRIDPKMDRKTERLHINGVYFEPNQEFDRENYEAISDSIWSLADFLGAPEIVPGEKVPPELKL
jgi:uncharacterized protein YcaQ